VDRADAINATAVCLKSAKPFCEPCGLTLARSDKGASATESLPAKSIGSDRPAAAANKAEANQRGAE
jgi:hypothetical protein